MQAKTRFIATALILIATVASFYAGSIGFGYKPPIQPMATPTGQHTLQLQATCGDGSCNGDETCSSCPQDCGTCPTGDCTIYVDDCGTSGGNGTPTDPYCRQGNNILDLGSPGDVICLRDGYYGEINDRDKHNSDYITIAAQPGHTPQIKRVNLSSCSNWILRGLAVSPEFAPEFGWYKRVLGVTASDSHDVIIEDCNIFSVEDSSSWTESDWLSLASDYGVHLEGSNMTLRNCNIKVFRIGIVVSATNSLIEHNEVSYIYEDGIVGAADDITLQYNTIKNFLKLSGHADGIQFHRGSDKSPMYNVVVRGNIVIGKEPDETNPLVKNSPQGITNFDSPPVNWLVENNIVLVNHSHGISIIGGTGYGAVDSKIMNNIAHNPWFDPSATQKMWAYISVGGGAENTVVRNNMSRILPGPNPSQNVIVENNIDIDDYGPEALFVDHENHDLRHKPGSPAIDAGDCESAPSEDIEGNPRPTDTGCDIGPYEFAEVVSCSTDSDCDDLDILPCADYVCDLGNTNNCILSDTDGTACNDNDECTLNDKCSNAICTGTQKNCDDSIDCTNDVCIAGECQNTPNDSLCGTDSICIDYRCDAILGCQVTYNIGAACDDGIACTEGDSCDSQGNCQGTANNSKCLEGFPLCTSATCDPTQGCINYQPAGCNIPSDLVLWMTFNEGSGNIAADSSESRNDGTLYNGPAWSTDCPEGNCLSFDGIDDYIEVQDSDSLASNNPEMTWSWWAKPSSLSSNRGLFSKYSTSDDQRSYLIYIYSGTNKQARANISNDGTNNSGHIDSSTTPVNYLILDEWHHYAAAFNSGTIKWYRDGSEFHSDSMDIGTIYNSTAPLLIGKWTYSWDGMLDEVRIYDKALSSQEIQAIYNEVAECVDMPALMNYIGQWKQGQITMLALMQKIALWKAGC